ncbi:hypothetical protein I3760_03G217600 [Carya illinoinensis]|nr:hypothetical protein I3760_03G217600 [Carya illinoinensis]
MDEGIRSLSRSLASSCNHLELSCYALKRSHDHCPIPLDSVSPSFIKSLNHQVLSMSSNLNMLDSMILDTVSFEELLGHCNKNYKKSQSDPFELQDCLKRRDSQYIYTALLGILERIGSTIFYFGQDCTTGSIIKSLEEDTLYH